jgi:hypothetical protein
MRTRVNTPLGLVIVRTQVVQCRLTGARGVHDHVAGRRRHGHQTASAACTPGLLERVAAASVDDGEGKARLLVGEVVENPLQWDGIVRHLRFAVRGYVHRDEIIRAAELHAMA